eukprot:1149448_1
MMNEPEGKSMKVEHVASDFIEEKSSSASAIKIEHTQKTMRKLYSKDAQISIRAAVPKLDSGILDKLRGIAILRGDERIATRWAKGPGGQKNKKNGQKQKQNVNFGPRFATPKVQNNDESEKNKKSKPVKIPKKSPNSQANAPLKSPSGALSPPTGSNVQLRWRSIDQRNQPSLLENPTENTSGGPKSPALKPGQSNKSPRLSAPSPLPRSHRPSFEWRRKSTGGESDNIPGPAAEQIPRKKSTTKKGDKKLKTAQHRARVDQLKSSTRQKKKKKKKPLTVPSKRDAVTICTCGAGDLSAWKDSESSLQNKRLHLKSLRRRLCTCGAKHGSPVPGSPAQTPTEPVVIEIRSPCSSTKSRSAGENGDDEKSADENPRKMKLVDLRRNESQKERNIGWQDSTVQATEIMASSMGYPPDVPNLRLKVSNIPEDCSARELCKFMQKNLEFGGLQCEGWMLFLGRDPCAHIFIPRAYALRAMALTGRTLRGYVLRIRLQPFARPDQLQRLEHPMHMHRRTVSGMVSPVERIEQPVPMWQRRSAPGMMPPVETMRKPGFPNLMIPPPGPHPRRPRVSSRYNRSPSPLGYPPHLGPPPHVMIRRPITPPSPFDHRRRSTGMYTPGAVGVAAYGPRPSTWFPRQRMSSGNVGMTSVPGGFRLPRSRGPLPPPVRMVLSPTSTASTSDAVKIRRAMKSAFAEKIHEDEMEEKAAAGTEEKKSNSSDSEGGKGAEDGKGADGGKEVEDGKGADDGKGAEDGKEVDGQKEASVQKATDGQKKAARLDPWVRRNETRHSSTKKHASSGNTADSMSATLRSPITASMVDCCASLSGEDFWDDASEVIERALNHGVGHIMVAGESISTSREAIKLAAHYPDVLSCCVGVHPNHIAECDAKTLPTLAKLCRYKYVRAIGPVGLDYSAADATHFEQFSWFEQQVLLACSTRKPLFVVDIRATKHVLRVLDQHLQQLPPVVIHAFCGSDAELREYVSRGFFVSFDGSIAQSAHLRRLSESVPFVPLNRLLVESNAPFATPDVDARVKRFAMRNEPCTIRVTVRVLAKAYQIPADRLAYQTAINACRVFRLGLMPRPPINHVGDCRNVTVGGFRVAPKITRPLTPEGVASLRSPHTVSGRSTPRRKTESPAEFESAKEEEEEKDIPEEKSAATEPSEQAVSVPHPPRKLDTTVKAVADPKYRAWRTSSFPTHSVVRAGTKVITFIVHGESQDAEAAVMNGNVELLSWNWEDARLTVRGHQQCKELGSTFQTMKFDLILVSTLIRALDSASVVFRHNRFRVPFLALETLRERYGKLPCDKRSSLRFLEDRFPHIDFGTVQKNEDPLWTLRREPEGSIIRRCEDFLDFVFSRKETVIAVVGHQSFFNVLVNKVIKLDNSEKYVAHGLEHCKFQHLIVEPIKK